VGLFKSFSRNPALRGAVCGIGAMYIRFVHTTTRWREEGRDAPERFWAEGRPFILAFWHGRLLMMAPFWNKKAKMNMLSSHHPDGRLISDTVAHFGVGTVYGSSSKGGGAALRQMVRVLKGGEYAGITPDGPRGPRMHASNGIVALARLAGVPVIPATFATENAKTLKSWDRFQVALPFGRGIYIWGEAIDISDMDEETARAKIENSLNELTALADRTMNRPAIKPAAAKEPS